MRASSPSGSRGLNRWSPVFYAEVSTAELYDICARQLGDVVSCAEALRAWIAAHPDRVDQAL